MNSTVAAIFGITAIEIVALATGQDGMFLGPTIAAMAGLGGFVAGTAKHRMGK